MVPKLALWLGLGVAGYQAGIVAAQYGARHRWFLASRDYCRKVGKPLLRIGIRRSPWEPPNGDMTLDIDPIILQVPGGVLGDVRNMVMFRDRQLGVCFIEHVLEHLYTPADVQLAVNEALRVADYVVILFPQADNISAYLDPTHRLLLHRVHGGLMACSIAHPDQCQAVVIPDDRAVVTST